MPYNQIKTKYAHAVKSTTPLLNQNREGNGCLDLLAFLPERVRISLETIDLFKMSISIRLTRGATHDGALEFSFDWLDHRHSRTHDKKA